jgi:hypothetical protein
VINGPAGATEQLLIRGVGPSLSQFGVTGVLAQPVLTLFDSNGQAITSNTYWTNSPNYTQILAAEQQVGAFQLSTASTDSALLVTLAPGSYTAQISGANGTTGVALAEVYEVSSSNAQLANISCRCFVGSGSGVAIAGFVVTGPSSRQVLIRGVGPTLSNFGIYGSLAQPVLSVVDSSGHQIASDTGWSTNSNAAQIIAAESSTGAFSLPAGSADSALLLTLPPGSYTAQVSGLNNTTGTALIEVYNVSLSN